MATIANLAVSLTARIGSFEKGFKKAQKIAARFGSDLARHTKTVAKYAAGLATAAAGAIAFFTKQQFEAIDSASKLSRTLGLTTEELAGYQHAAELAGVNSDALVKGITRMNRTVADAESGLSTAQRELERVGLSAEMLAGMSTDQRIKLLADRYNSIGDAAARSSFLMNVFGRAGLGIGNMFEQGAAGIEAAQKEAEQLGLTFSELDARKIEEANDAITRLKALITGAARALAIQLAPFVSYVADELRRMGTEGEGTGQIVADAFSRGIKSAAKLADWFEFLKAAWYSFEAVILGAAATLIQPARLFIKAWQPVLDFLGMGGSNLEQFFDDLSSGFTDGVVDATGKASAALEKFNEGFHSKQAEGFFETIKQRADAAAKSALDAGMDVEEMLSKSSGKIGEFQQIDLRRVAVGGVSANPQDKGVNRKQGDTMIAKLSEIARNTSSPMAVTS